MPTGSIFSMEQTTIAVSLASRSTSNSISFHPAMDISIKHCPTGERISPFSTTATSSSSDSQIPPPVPPSVNAGRTISGYPISWANASASCTLSAIADGGTGSWIFFIKVRKLSRFSALSIASISVPRISIPNWSKMPSWESESAILSPVCPPKEGRIASGFSLCRMRFMKSTVKGSIYTRLATPLSVMIVAGLELTRTTSTPSSLSDAHACVPA